VRFVINSRYHSPPSNAFGSYDGEAFGSHDDILLRQLEYLNALAREGHFGRAAEACHVTQPALSAGIRKLETELRVQIVRRGQRFEGFTPEGTQVLKWAQRMVAEQEALRNELDTMRGELSGVLRIGAIPTALTVASLLTTPMRRQHPMVRFSLESMSSRDIVSRLNDFDIDVGMTYVDGEPLGRVRVIPLYRERYLFLTPRAGEFTGRDSITWAEAASAPLCLLTPAMLGAAQLGPVHRERPRCTNDHPGLTEGANYAGIAQEPTSTRCGARRTAPPHIGPNPNPLRRHIQFGGLSSRT
jgi:DNA-binding transcriptional LysR family regulator